MGQTSSMHVQLERGTYFPGERVRGTVHVHLAEAFDSDGIKLLAIGKEPIMKGEHMLAEKSAIPPGMYTYPFEFSLPEDAPASLEWEQGDFKNESNIGLNGRARTSYFVQAIGMKPGSLIRDVKSEPLTFTVIEHTMRTVTPSGPVTVNDTQDSVSCCCFKGGSLSASLTAATNVVEPGSKLSYTAELTNNSNGAIKSVEVSLKQRVTLFGGLYSSGKSIKSKQAFVGNLNQESITLTQAQLKPGSGTNKFKGDLGPVPQGFLMTQSNSVIKVESYVELMAKMGAVTKNFKLQAPVILGLIKDGPVTSSYPYTPTNYGYSNKADPETVLLSYSFPKLDAPPDWSPLTFKPAALKLTTSGGAAGTPAVDDDGKDDDVDEYYKKSGW